MPDEFTVSVIIPSLNALTLSRALDALAVQTRPPNEIVVVGRDEVNLLANYPDVVFIDTQTPVCAASARNRGIETAVGNLLLFCDSDCIPALDWVAAHVKRHQTGEKVVGGSVALKGSNYWAQSDNVSMFHEFVPAHPPGKRHLLPTLNISVQRDVVEQVGGMDESFPGAAAEDADWTIRMYCAGFNLFFAPEALVEHVPARTAWTDVVRHWRNLGHNAVRVRLRYAEMLNTPAFAREALWWRLLSPLIAAKVTAGIYTQSLFWRYWRSLPVVYVTKIIYCWGAAQSVASGYAFQE